jgi:tRNA dimethylallyltransferase
VKTNKTLLLIAGPTASGKTDVSIALAKRYNTCVISTDSRQFYKEMKIGTAVPSDEDLKQVKHYFIGHLSVHDYYNIYKFETDALSVLNECFQTKDTVIACGGSGLYIDALCYGVDDFPDPDPHLRKELTEHIRNNRIDVLLQQLSELDPAYYEIVDKNNPHRILRAVEVCLQTGKTYSSQRKQNQKERQFTVKKYCLDVAREILYQRINRRTDQMIAQGLIEEAKALYPLRYLNALNTVGYKEIFEYLEGKSTLEESIANIKTHTRRYAKRQITWFKRDTTYQWISPEEAIENI